MCRLQCRPRRPNRNETGQGSYCITSWSRRYSRRLATELQTTKFFSFLTCPVSSLFDLFLKIYYSFSPCLVPPSLKNTFSPKRNESWDMLGRIQPVEASLLGGGRMHSSATFGGVFEFRLVLSRRCDAILLKEAAFPNSYVFTSLKLRRNTVGEWT